jgi:DNA-binding response OmpR family regulator
MKRTSVGNGITISHHQATERRNGFVLRVNGSSVALTNKEADLLRSLYKHRGQVLAYRQFSPVLRADCTRRHGAQLLRQYMLTLRGKLRKCKAPYTLAVSYNLGYALCRIAPTRRPV